MNMTSSCEQSMMSSETVLLEYHSTSPSTTVSHTKGGISAATVESTESSMRAGLGLILLAAFGKHLSQDLQPPARVPSCCATDISMQSLG